MNRQQRLEKFRDIDLYPVITEAYCAGRSSLEVCEAVLDAGAKIVQLREKDRPQEALLNLAREMRVLTRAAGALLIINDDLELALAVEADGVHLGQEDMPLSKARALAPECLIGNSTHNLEEAKIAVESGADYINIGPVFATQTKQLPMQALGPAMVREIASQINVPYTVMGGIHEGNLHELLAINVRRIAMVTAVTQAADVREKTAFLRHRILSAPAL